VHNLDAVSRLPEVLAYLFRDHDRAMLSTRAAEANRQIALAFVDVVGQQVNQQFGDTLYEFFGLRKGANVFGHARMPSGERTELGHKMWIGQEADVEDQICVLGDTVAKAEAYARHQNTFLCGFLPETLSDVCAEFVNIKFGSVDHEVGQGADVAQMTAFSSEGRLHGSIGTERMGTASFTEAADQYGVGGFQINHLGRDHPPDRFEDSWKLFQLGTLAYVYHKRCAPNLRRLHCQFREPRDQLHRKIVHAVVAQVLKGFEHRSLARPAHACNDDQLGGLLSLAMGTSRSLSSVSARRHQALALPTVAVQTAGIAARYHFDDSSIEVFPEAWPGDRRFPLASAHPFVSELLGQVSYGAMKKFEELTEREVLALAISLEEEDERVYADFAEGLRPDYPASAAMFEGMREEESGHRRRLIELYRQKFGEHIPLVRRHDVRGFVERPALWLIRPMRIDAVRKEASTLEVETRLFYEKAAARTQDASIRQLLDDLANEEREHENRAQELDKQKLPASVKEEEEKAQRRLFVLQIVQPGLAGLMDGSVSTLAPVFAAAFATKNSWDAFLVGLAASAGAGISMGFAEALSDDGSLTGRGHPWVRGVICGAMTALGGIGHTLPFLLRDFRVALWAAGAVVVAELGVITWIRRRYMDTPWFSAAMQVGLGGALVFLAGVMIGKYA
jgi:rubrerythrin